MNTNKSQKYGKITILSEVAMIHSSRTTDGWFINTAFCVIQSGNAVDLIPSVSASIYQQAFVVTTDTKNLTPGTASILEVSAELN